MFKLHAVQAQFGDCLILEFGTGAKRQFILIDGGPPDNFEADLDAALREIVGAGGKLELLILSHVDNDHVVGVLDVLAALEDDAANDRQLRVEIAGLWHNSFRRTIDTEGEITQRLQNLMAMAGEQGAAMPFSTNALLGIQEGHQLRVMAKKLGLPINKGFAGDVIQVETAPQAIKVGPLSLRIVGPDRANLDELRKKWLEWLAKTEADVVADPKTAANSDTSVPNLSSIVIVAECDGKRMLLTGDARSDHIASGLKTAGLLDGQGRLHVDLFKVQHHGSNRNATRRFFEMVTADTYVISANGKHGNPDLDTLQWIVDAAVKHGRKIRIVVTNETPATRTLQQTMTAAQREKVELIAKPAGRHSIAIDLGAAGASAEARASARSAERAPKRAAARKPAKKPASKKRKTKKPAAKKRRAKKAAGRR